MQSFEKSVGAIPEAINEGLCSKFTVFFKSGTLKLTNSAGSTDVQLFGEPFTVSGARERNIDTADWYLEGPGTAVVWIYPTIGVLSPAVTVDEYNAETNFSTLLDNMFLDKFLTDEVTYTLAAGGTSTLRASIEDERILIGDGQTQYQTLLKTAHFKVADMPTGYKVGDTVTISGVAWKANEILEQDQYTVKFALSKTAR